MTDWNAVIADKMKLPEGMTTSGALIELTQMLRSPDPVTRDELATTAIMLLLDDLDEAAGRQGGARRTSTVPPRRLTRPVPSPRRR